MRCLQRRVSDAILDSSSPTLAPTNTDPQTRAREGPAARHIDQGGRFAPAYRHFV